MYYITEKDNVENGLVILFETCFYPDGGGIMYTQTQNLNKKHSPGAIIVTAVIAAGLITAQHMIVSVHDSVHDNVTQPVYADADSQGSIVVFDTGYNQRGLLGYPDEIDNASQPSWLDSVRESIGSLREDMISLIPNEIETSHIDDVSSVGDSGVQVTQTATSSPSDSLVHCEQSFPIDVTSHSQSALIRRALDHCLIESNDDNKVLPDSILTHDMMLTIADRAGFDVDLNRGSSKAVTRDDLKRFLDYLLASKQIDGVPVQRYNDMITRIEYLTVVRDIIPVSQLLPEATVLPLPSSPTSLVTPEKTATTMTVADFKKKLNTKLATPLTIMSYDATIIATTEIQQSILLDVINGGSVLSNAHGSAPSSQPSQGPIVENQSGIGVNKEMLKTLLGGLVENL